MSLQVQYLIIFIILGGVVAWILYKLLHKGKKDAPSCMGCCNSSNCKVKDIYRKKKFGKSPQDCEYFDSQSDITDSN